MLKDSRYQPYGAVMETHNQLLISVIDIATLALRTLGEGSKLLEHAIQTCEMSSEVRSLCERIIIINQEGIDAVSFELETAQQQRPDDCH